MDLDPPKLLKNKHLSQKSWTLDPRKLLKTSNIVSAERHGSNKVAFGALHTLARGHPSHA